MSDKHKKQLINEIINRICGAEGYFTNFIIRRNERKLAEKAEEKAFEELKNSNQELQDFFMELREEK